VSQYAQRTGLSEDFIRSHPAILKLVRRAIKEDWLASPQGLANFDLAFTQTPWFKNNASYARTYMMMAAKGGADFDSKIETTREAIRARAQQLGAVLDDKALDTFATAYHMNGWGEEGRGVFLDRALMGELDDFDTNYIDFTKGGAETIGTSLREMARANGVRYNDSYFEGAAKSVLSGLSTLEDYASEIRQAAASQLPMYAERIKAGENARDILSPYVNTYAKIYGKDPNSIELDDPYVKEAYGQVDKDGKPAAVGLWEYEKLLRKKPGYEYTQDAQERVSQLTGEIVRMFGFGG
jgi:hypothetical protein